MNKVTLHNMLLDFLCEDIQHCDITSESIFPDDEMGTASFYMKEDGILSGTAIITEAYQILNKDIEVVLLKNDGDKVEQGEEIATVSGSIQSILSGERVILNLLQRMSGIATQTAKAIVALNNDNIKITDTRKTTPGLRMLEKYAVTCGGGYNHRFGLYDMVMIKDNHISFAGSITKAVKKVRTKLGPTVKIEVETESITEVEEAVKQNVDIIMFDNCTVEEINEMAQYVPNHILTEASGGITFHTLGNYRDANVDFISLGFLTHSVKALDISLTIKGGI